MAIEKQLCLRVRERHSGTLPFILMA